MGRPDTLSWRSDHPCRKDDNANITLLPSDVFEVCNMEATLVDSRGNELVEHIWRSMDYDDTVVKALQELGAGMLQSDEWERDGDLVMYRGHVYVPKDPQLCHNIVHAHHDSMMTGHPGWWKMLELASCNYWWLGIFHYIASYVVGCDTCNQCKSFPMQKVGKCHAPSWLDLGEPSHMRIHLTTDHDSTQLNAPPHVGNMEYSLTQTSPGRQGWHIDSAHTIFIHLAYNTLCFM